MSRKQLVDIHIYLAAFFLPFFLLLPLSGFLYLIGEKGSTPKELVFEIDQKVSPEQLKSSEFWDPIFKEKNIENNYEYIKTKGKVAQFRPASRDHYRVELNESGAKIFIAKPDLIQKMIQLHIGHGPRWFKRLEIGAAIALLLLAISGGILSWTVPEYRKKFLFPMIGGVVVVLATLTVLTV